MQPEPSGIAIPTRRRQFMGRQATALRAADFANPVTIEAALATEVVLADRALASAAGKARGVQWRPRLRRVVRFVVGRARLRIGTWRQVLP